MTDSTRAEIQRRILVLVGAIVALDAVIIGLYYAFHIAERPMKTQQTFVAVWVVLTLAIVTTLMKRVRELRRRRWRQ